MPTSARDWIESFTIIERYTDTTGAAGVCVEHDQLWAGPDTVFNGTDHLRISAADMKRLSELGWFIDEDTERLSCNVTC